MTDEEPKPVRRQPEAPIVPPWWRGYHMVFYSQETRARAYEDHVGGEEDPIPLSLAIEAAIWMMKDRTFVEWVEALAAQQAKRRELEALETMTFAEIDEAVRDWPHKMATIDLPRQYAEWFLYNRGLYRGASVQDDLARLAWHAVLAGIAPTEPALRAFYEARQAERNHFYFIERD